MEKFDAYLAFDLPEDYYLIKDANEDGDVSYKVAAGKKLDDKGEESYDYSAAINLVDAEKSPFGGGEDAGFSLKGNLENVVAVTSQEMNVLIFTVTVYTAIIWLKKNDHIYALISTRVVRANDDGENIRGWTGFLTDVLSSVVLDGTKSQLETLTSEKLLSGNRDLDAEEAANSNIPIAKPLENQHTHLDFLNKTRASMSLFGGLISVNETGTEYAFRSICGMEDDGASGEIPSMIETIARTDRSEFDLVDTAKTMAELFRVNAEAFDAAHDREQEILNGLIQRASIYNTFRSFAWTLQAYCEKEGLVPAALSFDTLQELVAFISDRGGLNYTADSFSSELCSGDDLHVYYIPDSVPESTKNQFVESLNEAPGTENAPPCGVKSLDGLRRELEYMYPAIRTIYDELEKDRDRDEALVDGVADILYAWCSMTYAAREPIFSEDGPMNCWWEHPDNQINWELQWKITALENAIKQEKEWVNRHKKDLTKNPSIAFKDKLFVFAGVGSLEEWPDILEAFLKNGGVQRTAVSGKTDYLVCHPAYAGDSQVKRAREQKAKGKAVKVILFDDFLKALNMTIKTPQEQLAELTGEKKVEKTDAPEKKLKPVDRPAVVPAAKKLPEDFTYDRHLLGKGDGYTMEIPDGFIIKNGAEDRDFIAYIPNENAPDDYLESRFIIFAGQRQEHNILSQFRTVAEYGAIGRAMAGSVGLGFLDISVMSYDREDLPGTIIFGFDPGCLHANAYVGIGDHLQMMRVQINDVTRTNRSGYETVVKELFDRMTATTPVQMLEHLDAEAYISMSPGSSVAKNWVETVGGFISHLSIARNLEQDGIVNAFKQNSNAGLPQLKKNLKDMLRRISRYAEEQLRKAEYIYTLKRAQNPDNHKLKALKESVEGLIELANQYVNLDGHRIAVDSVYASEVKKRLSLPTSQAVEQLLESAPSEDGSKALEALRVLWGSRAEELKAAEEKKLRNEREAAKQKRLAKKRKKAEEAAALDKERKEREKFLADNISYNQACAHVKTQREKLLTLRTEEKKQMLLQQIREDFLKQQEALHGRLETAKAELDATKEKLAGLGFFKFSEKKACNEKITRLELDIVGIQNLISDLPRKQQTREFDVDGVLRNCSQELRSDVEKELPMPEMPESVRKDRERLKNEMAALKEKILAHIGKNETSFSSIVSAIELPLGANQTHLDTLLWEMETHDQTIERMDIISQRSYIKKSSWDYQSEQNQIMRKIAAVLKKKSHLLMSDILNEDPELRNYPERQVYNALRKMWFTDLTVTKDISGRFAYYSLALPYMPEPTPDPAAEADSQGNRDKHSATKQRILDVLRADRLMTVQEIMDADPVLGGESDQKITSIVWQMYQTDHTVERDEIQHKSYFRLP